VRDAAKADIKPEGFMRRVIDAFGARRIAWGSNYPASEGTLGGLLAEARQAVSALPGGDQEWIFSRTANSLY
jgi:predicted TIM-barrel fold metal-dependent hydrolase